VCGGLVVFVLEVVCDTPLGWKDNDISIPVCYRVAIKATKRGTMGSHCVRNFLKTACVINACAYIGLHGRRSSKD
jgi:hypothetical protein